MRNKLAKLNETIRDESRVVAADVAARERGGGRGCFPNENYAD